MTIQFQMLALCWQMLATRLVPSTVVLVPKPVVLDDGMHQMEQKLHKTVAVLSLWFVEEETFHLLLDCS